MIEVMLLLAAGTLPPQDMAAVRRTLPPQDMLAVAPTKGCSHCTPACECGCQQGQPCRCTSTAPVVQPVQVYSPPVYFQPASFSTGFASGGGGC